jgi:hypothetical protein
MIAGRLPGRFPGMSNCAPIADSIRAGKVAYRSSPAQSREPSRSNRAVDSEFGLVAGGDYSADGPGRTVARDERFGWRRMGAAYRALTRAMLARQPPMQKSSNSSAFSMWCRKRDSNPRRCPVFAGKPCARQPVQRPEQDGCVTLAPNTTEPVASRLLRKLSMRLRSSLQAQSPRQAPRPAHRPPHHPPRPLQPNLHNKRGITAHLPRVPSLEAFGRRPWCQSTSPTIGPASETLHNTLAPQQR